MRQSTLFTKTRREAPSGEVAKNAQLLIRAGFVHKEMAGVYALLPLGLRVFKKIKAVIRKEINNIGGQEMRLATLQDPAVWQASGRWSDEAVDIWFKSTLKNGAEVGIANTHEEPLTNILTEHVASYKDLPVYAYQFQTKFRNELRAKSGMMRVREFVMKDLYSYSIDEKAHEDFYEKCADAYRRIFDTVGIGDVTFRTFASGGSFSKYSHEFQTISEAGEDTIYVDEEKNVAVNKEVYDDEVLGELGLKKEKLIEKKAIEVANIFPLGTRFAEALSLRFQGEDGRERYPVMGSYGIGLERLMATVAEVLSDEKGLVWPKTAAPYLLHLVELSGGDENVKKEAEALYAELEKHGVEVLYDDRSVQAGEKFADADLIGIPYRAVVSGKTIAENKVEITERAGGESRMVSKDELLQQLST